MSLTEPGSYSRQCPLVTQNLHYFEVSAKIELGPDGAGEAQGHTEFHLLVAPGIVPVETMNWGTIKALYR